MSTSLPTEITDEVIDCVYEDRGTLLSCSLTCRSWRSRSQYHLFSFFNLDGRDLQGIERLSAMLTNAPHIVAHIRHVQLPVDLECCDSFLSICPLTCVEELTLMEPGSWTRCGLLVRPGNDYARLLVTAFPNTRSVTFMHIEFAHFSVLLELMRAFPRLAHACLCDTLLENYQDYQHLTLQPHGPHDPSLLSLSLRGCFGNFFEPWLDPSVYPLMQGLSRLDLFFTDHDDATSIGVLAGRVSRTLVEVDVTAVRLETAKDMIDAYSTNVLPNPVLRYARISIGPHSQNTASDSTLAVLLAYMRRMGLDNCAKIEIIVQHDEPNTFEWHAAQEELSRAPFPCQLTLSAPGLVYASEQD